MMFCIVLLYEEPSCCSLPSCFAYTHPPLCKLSQSQPLASQRFPFRREEVKHYRQKGKAGSSEIMAARFDLHVWVLSCVRVSVFVWLWVLQNLIPMALRMSHGSEQASLFITSAIRAPALYIVCMHICVCVHMYVCNILVNAYQEKICCFNVVFNDFPPPPLTN